MIIKKHVLFFLLFIPVAFFSQQYSFVNYSINQGLAQSQVQAICQDKKGYLWIATFGGLSRFDGRNFKNFFKTEGLPDNEITALLCDSANQLWIGTTSGLATYNNEKIFTPKILENTFDKTIIKSIAQGSSNTIYIATKEEIFSYYPLKNQLNSICKINSANNLFEKIFIDRNQNIWVATKNGLLKKDANSNSFEQVKTIDSTIHVLSISEKDGLLCLSTKTDGVIYISSTTGIISNKQSFPEYLPNIYTDSEKNSWLSSQEKLFKIQNDYSIKEYSTQNGLPTNLINCVFEDKEHNIWIGTDGSGLVKFLGEKFISYKKQDGLSNNAVMSIAQDKLNNLWIGTYGGGINKLENGQFKKAINNSAIANEIIYKCFIDNAGKLWFNTADKFYSYNPTSNKLTEEIIGVKEFVLSMYQSKNNTYYLGTWLGLYEYKGTGNANLINSCNFDSEHINDIFIDNKNQLSIASSGGVCFLNGNNSKSYTVKDGLCDNLVYNIKQDFKGNYWIGTNAGLNILKNDKIDTLVFSDNPAANRIVSTYIDKKNNFWIGTYFGLYRFDLNEYYSENKPYKIQNYSISDGVSSLEFNQNAIWGDSSGDIYFGTVDGLLKYQHEKDKKTNVLPEVIISGIRLFLQKKDLTDFSSGIDSKTGLPLDLKLNFKNNYVTIDFNAIYFTHPEKIRYKFKLDGFDSDWLPATEANFATYSNLSEGEYVFYVTTSIDGYNWLEPVTFKFTITPPFFRTWWFILSCFIALVIATWLIYNWRLTVAKRKRLTQQLLYRSKLLALEQQTLNASMNRHFIFNSLNSIQYYINRQDKLAANKYLTSFAKLIRKNLDSSQNNFVLLKEELERLQLYISLEQMRFTRFEYEIVVSPEVNTEEVQIPPMIIQPFVENSIWHGLLPLEEVGKLSIFVNMLTSSELCFVIEDNGVGIDASYEKKTLFPTEHDSKGTEITVTRINLLRKMTGMKIEIKGPYDLKNEGKRGTRVEIVIELKKNV
ncbi:MAG: histidine kinase [Bacteroidetes bacterium]|nr:histidine kinase [Bacteroidota bacterium]